MFFKFFHQLLPSILAQLCLLDRLYRGIWMASSFHNLLIHLQSLDRHDVIANFIHLNLLMEHHLPLRYYQLTDHSNYSFYFKFHLLIPRNHLEYSLFRVVVLLHFIYYLLHSFCYVDLNQFLFIIEIISLSPTVLL